MKLQALLIQCIVYEVVTFNVKCSLEHPAILYAAECCYQRLTMAMYLTYMHALTFNNRKCSTFR